MENARRASHITRSSSDRVLAGVAGGLAAYLGVDATWVRIAMAVASVFWGFGLIVYAILWVTLPESGLDDTKEEEIRPPLVTDQPRMVAGIALVALGALLLWWRVLSWLSLGFVLPVVFVLLGIFLIQRRGGTD